MFKRTSRGFTLIELLVVIAIIGILSSVVLASLNDARQKSRDAKRIADVKQLQLANELYFDSNGSYAITLADLAPDFISVVPTDPVGGGSYLYAALGAAAACTTSTDYHLGATLEQTTHTALGSDADAAETTVECTGSDTDYAGTDPIYDVKP
jgi:prepilin-type N-terminal cleavage/methylation domain-containing protein